jgi:hypothetical protein
MLPEQRKPFSNSRFENGLDFAADVGHVPLVYHIAEDRHNIKAVGGVNE